MKKFILFISLVFIFIAWDSHASNCESQKDEGWSEEEIAFCKDNPEVFKLLFEEQDSEEVIEIEEEPEVIEVEEEEGIDISLIPNPENLPILNFEELQAEQDKNEVKFEANYPNDRSYIFSGTIKRLSEGCYDDRNVYGNYICDVPIIEFEESLLASSTECVLKKTDISILLDLENGNKIAVEGKQYNNNYNGYIIKPCKVIYP